GRIRRGSAARTTSGPRWSWLIAASAWPRPSTAIRPPSRRHPLPPPRPPTTSSRASGSHPTPAAASPWCPRCSSLSPPGVPSAGLGRARRTRCVHLYSRAEIVLPGLLEGVGAAWSAGAPTQAEIGEGDGAIMKNERRLEGWPQHVSVNGMLRYSSGRGGG